MKATSTLRNDAIGRRTKRYDGGSAFAAVVTNLFGYNTRSELTNAVMGDLLYGYRFDNIGNREWSKTNGTELTYVANELNQYTQIANGVTNNPTYDLDGNLLTDGTWTNAWDGENRLVGVTPLNVVTGSKKLQMAYDYMGRRVRKAVLEWDGSSWQTNKTSYFTFDGWNLLSEYSVLPSSVQTNWFVWGLDLSGSLQGAGGIGGLISSQLTDPATSNRVTVLYTFDGNGNVSECLTPDGEIVAHYEYSPNAALFSSTGRMAKSNPIRFSTKWWDDETGLGYWGYRWYGESRWLSRDPIGEEGGLNIGVFVKNDAVNGSDAFGLQFIFPPSDMWPDLEGGWGRHFPRLPNPHAVMCNWLEDYINDYYLASSQDRRSWRRFCGGSGQDLSLGSGEVLDIVDHHSGMGSDWLQKKVSACEDIADLLYLFPGGDLTVSETYLGSVEAPWARSIGTTTVSATLTCKCRCLTYSISIDDPYDFDPVWIDTPRTRSNEWRTRLVWLADNASNCGWKPFRQVGTATGSRGSGCPK